MNNAIFKTSVVLLSLIICSSSFASDATEAQTGFRLTPRLWLSYIDLSGGPQKLDNVLSSESLRKERR